MTQLNQILAIDTGVRQRNYAEIGEIYKRLQKGELVQGHTRVYSPKDEAGDQLPSETKLVQVRVHESLDAVRELTSRMWDVAATKEWANQKACADVVLDDGTVVLPKVPVTYLLYLEKQLSDIHAMFAILPLLDPQYTWKFDEGSNAWRSEPQQRTRTEKVPKAFVKYDATDKHPAQVEMWMEDQIIGFWEATQFSGAMPARERVKLVQRVESLQRAVKMAREKANNMDVEDPKPSGLLLDYLFGDSKVSASAE